MFIKMLYVLECDGKVLYFDNETDRVWAINMIKLDPHGKISTYELDMDLITTLLHVRKV